MTPNGEPTTEAGRTALLNACQRLRSSLIAPRRDWHEVSVKPDDIAVVLAALREAEARATATPGLDVDRIVSLAKAAAWSARYNPERSLDEIADDFRAALAASGETVPS